jgi:hypothetical protein
LTRRLARFRLAVKRQAFSRRAVSWSSLTGSAPFRKDYSLIVSSSTEKTRLFERLGPWGSGWHLPRFLKGINRSRVQAAAVVHRISCDGHHMSVIALGAIECADIEAGWAPRNTRQMHPYIAFWAMRLLAGDEWVTGRGISFYHQPSNACASNQPSFLTSVRSDAAAGRSWFRFGPLGRDWARRRISRRFSTTSAIL